jgi:hypothetical protein
MGRGMVIVTRELTQEFYPLVDDILLMKVCLRFLQSLLSALPSPSSSAYVS